MSKKNSKQCLLRKDATQKESVPLFEIERRKSPERNTRRRLFPPSPESSTVAVGHRYQVSSQWRELFNGRDELILSRDTHPRIQHPIHYLSNSTHKRHAYLGFKQHTIQKHAHLGIQTSHARNTPSHLGIQTAHTRNNPSHARNLSPPHHTQDTSPYPPPTRARHLDVKQHQQEKVSNRTNKMHLNLDITQHKQSEASQPCGGTKHHA